LISAGPASDSHHDLASNRHLKIPEKSFQKFASQLAVGRLLEVHFIGGETYARNPNKKELQTMVVHNADFTLLRQPNYAYARGPRPAGHCAESGPFELEFMFSRPTL
jgi:hypothetical protein